MSAVFVPRLLCRDALRAAPRFAGLAPPKSTGRGRASGRLRQVVCRGYGHLLRRGVREACRGQSRVLRFPSISTSRGEAIAAASQHDLAENACSHRLKPGPGSSYKASLSRAYFFLKRWLRSGPARSRASARGSSCFGKPGEVPFFDGRKRRLTAVKHRDEQVLMAELRALHTDHFGECIIHESRPCCG